MNDDNSANAVANNISAAALLLDEWKWRHQHCWKVLYRFGLTGLTVALIPYLRRLDLIQAKVGNLVGKLGSWELFFPITALVIAQAAVWLFAEEYIRCRPVETMFHRVLKRHSHNPLPVKDTPPINQKTSESLRLTLKSIGQTTILVYSALATIISLFNTWLLIVLADLPIDQTRFWIVGVTLSLLLIAGAVYVSWRSGEKIRDIIRKQEEAETPVSSTPVA